MLLLRNNIQHFYNSIYLIINYALAQLRPDSVLHLGLQMFFARKSSGSSMLFFARKRSGSSMMLVTQSLPQDMAFLNCVPWFQRMFGRPLKSDLKPY